ncbi:DNA/RNA polymerases superfamily protein [Gossypium australe]|uniref:DNA/RNA polymerases superfamily protein n=1 Tax=Gossypium australe TaxID=47621 RepID=A0A5B6VY47_9ROSI|nr:DNA/RNA polymerases superfamily protein [Gossypium australe]
MTDFVSRLSLTPKKKDAILVIVDRLTKFAHLIPIKTDYSLKKLVELYIDEIARLHGVPLSIISIKTQGKLHEALGTKLNFNTHFYSQTDGQSERLIQILEDIWEKYLSLAEFAYNNNYQTSIKMAPYKALYGQKCRTLLYSFELSERKLVGTDLIRKQKKRLELIRDCLKINDKDFLKVSPLKKILRFDRKGKLSPRFIRPYEILKRIELLVYCNTPHPYSMSK